MLTGFVLRAIAWTLCLCAWVQGTRDRRQPEGEADAIRHLADKLKENPDMTREEAYAECARFAITKRGFLHRVSRKLERRPVCQRGLQRAANGTIDARNRSANQSANLIAAAICPPFDCACCSPTQLQSLRTKRSNDD